MSYVLVRMYPPTGDRTPEELSQRAANELVPQLLKIGCQRYTAVKFLNGHIGSTSVYATTASAQDVKEALDQEAVPILQKSAGLLRYTCFRFDEGDHFAVMTAHSTRESATRLTAEAREAIKDGSRLQKVFGRPPEVIEGDIIQSYTS